MAKRKQLIDDINDDIQQMPKIHPSDESQLPVYENPEYVRFIEKMKKKGKKYFHYTKQVSYPAVVCRKEELEGVLREIGVRCVVDMWDKSYIIHPI